MKKFSIQFSTLVMPFLIVSLLTSCRKEGFEQEKMAGLDQARSGKKEIRKPFKLTTDTWYRISPAAPEPIIVNGQDYVGFAYFPGGGEGNATHMGKVNTFFNQLAYTLAPVTPLSTPAGSVSAPVIDAVGYPILGAPLPLIQAGDFSGLAQVITQLQIPAENMGRVVVQVIYNKKGDAIFLSANTGSGGTFPVSPTVVGFNGTATIVGGRGKFIDAYGELNFEGYFNVLDANDAGYNAEGWISY